jgi:hypothetical protein
MRLPLSYLVRLSLLSAACTPDIGTDPVPEVVPFEPTARPALVPEPSRLAINRTTGKVDLSIAGIVVPADCQTVADAARAQCELNQYLQTLDGFPTTASAKTPLHAAVDVASLTPANVAVVKVVPTVTPAGTVQAVPSKVPAGEAIIGASADGKTIQVLPAKPWPVASEILVGVRGYQSGITVTGKPVVASTTYNLLKREESLTCPLPGMTVTTAEAIDENCKFLLLLRQQMPDAMARVSLLTLEQLRLGFTTPANAWMAMELVGGIPKKEVAILWTFPVHSASVIDGLPVPAGADEVRLAVNGAVDPATVSAFRVAEDPGSVVLMNLGALGKSPPDLSAGFPRATAHFADGQIIIKAAAPLEPGAIYGIAVLKSAKNPAGVPLVPPPITVLLMARGPVVVDGKITVSALGDLATASQLEAGRMQLRALLDNESIGELTGVRREQIAYLIAFAWGS